MRWLALAVGLLALAAPAHNHEKGHIQVRHAWSRATPPGATVGVGYMEIRNRSAQPDKLIYAATPMAETVEFHVTQREGDIMKMRQVKVFELRSRERFVMRPGASHLMLVELLRPLKQGERIPMTLRFERAGELEIELEVQETGSRHPRH